MKNLYMNLKTLFLFHLLGLFGCLHAQTYHRMLDNPSWTVWVSGGAWGDSYHKGIIKLGDTIIESKSYVVIYDSIALNTPFIKILREDSVARKVYIREDGQDKILFDFSLQVSDKIVFNDGEEYTVHNIDSINVRGGTRKMLFLTHPLHGSQTWIEGVGSKEHPLIQRKIISTAVYLLCSFKGGINIFNYGIYSSSQDTSDCKPYDPNISAKNISAEEYLKIYPNPTNNLLTIDFTTVTPIKIEIQDIHGRKVYSQTVSPTQNTHEVSLADVSRGVYFVKLHSSEGVVLKKIIKE